MPGHPGEALRDLCHVSRLQDTSTGALRGAGPTVSEADGHPVAVLARLRAEVDAEHGEPLLGLSHERNAASVPAHFDRHKFRLVRMGEFDGLALQGSDLVMRRLDPGRWRNGPGVRRVSRGRDAERDAAESSQAPANIGAWLMPRL